MPVAKATPTTYSFKKTPFENPPAERAIRYAIENLQGSTYPHRVEEQGPGAYAIYNGSKEPAAFLRLREGKEQDTITLQTPIRKPGKPLIPVIEEIVDKAAKRHNGEIQKPALAAGR